MSSSNTKIVEKVVVDALREVQALGGHSQLLPPSGAPVIGALEGFDSLTGIEATVMVEAALGRAFGRSGPIELKLDTVFVSKDGRKALCFGEVVAVVCSALEAQL